MVAYAKPTKLDFDKIDSASEDANYMMTGVKLRVQGEVVSGSCSTCKAKVSYLVLPGTKERIELSEMHPTGSATLEGDVLDWNGAHPRLELK